MRRIILISAYWLGFFAAGVTIFRPIADFFKLKTMVENCK